jgi:hypothetical protein
MCGAVWCVGWFWCVRSRARGLADLGARAFCVGRGSWATGSARHVEWRRASRMAALDGVWRRCRECDRELSASPPPAVLWSRQRGDARDCPPGVLGRVGTSRGVGQQCAGLPWIRTWLRDAPVAHRVSRPRRDLSRECERLLQRAACLRAWPACDGGGDALGRVGGLGGEIEDRLQLVGARRLYPELVGVGGDPIAWRACRRRTPGLSWRPPARRGAPCRPA